MNFSTGDLVCVVSPNSLAKMNVVGIITELKYPSRNWFKVWIPDISRHISFDRNQLKKIE